MQRFDTIGLEQEDGLATLTLDRPDSLNALSEQMLGEIVAALDRIAGAGARALLVTGRGRAFSAGADLGGSGLPPDLGLLLETGYNPMIRKLFALPMPVVVAVNGPAAGAGCSLALAGDLVLAARSAYFVQAFVNIGLVPDAGASWLLPRLVGRQRALEMMLLGERVPAETAAGWGMIHRAVDDAALIEEARALARRLAAGPTRAYALIRQGLRAALDGDLAAALDIERDHQREAGRTADAAEGIAAFLAKRPARFTGR